MPDPPHQKDDTWLAQLSCPQYFDFSAALQAPCSVDLQYNPPLHDFVYQSDEESNNFFRNAAASAPSPIPIHEQPRMLDPRHFGKPVYRHRPKTTFEEFLRQYHMRRRKQRRSVHDIASADTVHLQAPNSPISSSPSTVDSRYRYKSLPSKQTDHPSLPPLESPEVCGGEDREHSSDINNPAKHSSRTPTVNRRAALRYTPSRVHNPLGNAISLSPALPSPLPSPLRKARRNPLGLRSNLVVSTEQLPFPSLEPTFNVIQKPHREVSPKISAPSTAISLRPPARTTPPAPNGGTGTSGNPASQLKASFDSKTNSYRGDKKSPDLLGPPRRNVRPFGSTISSSSESPPVPSITQMSIPIPSRSLGADSQTEERNEGKASILQIASPSSLRPASFQDQDSRPTCDHDAEKNWEQRVNESPAGVGPSTGIDDPDLLRKLKEHNRRLRKSGRHVPKDLLDIMDENPSLSGESQVDPFKAQTNKWVGLSSVSTVKPPQSFNVLGTKHKEVHQLSPAVPKSTELGFMRRTITEQTSERSLQDLLSLENKRVLQERKQRFPEQRRARKLNKESVLQGMERKNTVSQTRVAAKVVFTPSTNAQKPCRGNIAFGKEVSKGSAEPPSVPVTKCGEKPVPRPQRKKAIQGFKTRSKSATAELPRDQNCNPNVSGNLVDSRSRPTNESVTDKVKALARKKRQEERMENDLKSMLNLHNSKVRSKRSGA